MPKKPYINALLASLYIALVVTVMNYMSQFTRNQPDGEGIAGPIGFLSLFVLSASVMGYLFLSQPLQLYFDGKKQEAISYFLRTIASFAVLTIIALAILFFSAR